nr:MAG TPA: hypothetical protein [Caudoviricetes sp.]
MKHKPSSQGQSPRLNVNIHTGRPGKVNASSPGGIETQTVQPRAEP